MVGVGHRADNKSNTLDCLSADRLFPLIYISSEFHSFEASKCRYSIYNVE